MIEKNAIPKDFIIVCIPSEFRQYSAHIHWLNKHLNG